MTKAICATAIAAALLSASPLTAQDRWGMEVRGAGAVATSDLGDADLGTGLGFEAAVRYRFLEHLAVYGGWDWMHFSTDESFLGSDVDVEETGYAFGLRFEHPIGGERGYPAAWVRAGGTWDHIEVESDEGDLLDDSGHGLGWEAGAGLALSVGSWQVTPGLRYRSLGRDLEVDATTREVDLRYLTLGIGLSRSF